VIYDCNGLRGPQFPADGTNCTIDATGKVLSPLSWCDTETGEACRYLVFGKDWVIGTDHRVVAVVGKYPAPLKRIKVTSLDAGKLEYAPYNGRVDKEPLLPNYIDKADCPVVREGQT
jgi:hypothetical protein